MADIFALSLPAPPKKLTTQALRAAITRTLTSQITAYDVADECVRLGLWPRATAKTCRAASGCT